MRDFVIRVKVMDEHKDGCHHDHSNTHNGEHLIVIVPSQANEIATEKIALAHELGHVLGHEFEEPGHMKLIGAQFLSKLEQFGLVSGGAVVKRETEAWDNAEQILKIRTKCMKSYKEDQIKASDIYMRYLIQIMTGRQQ